MFAYDPWKKAGALDVIYARTRRFWGADIEDLNDTLPLMKAAIKGVSWLTLVGRDFARRPDVAAEIEGLSAVSSVTIEERTNATLVAAGPEPVPGDQNRPDRSLDPYYAVANALKPLFLDAHPDFPSGRFVDNGNTVGWIRRFIEPAGWR